MSRYSGRYYRGASRDMRERKRIEAETRDTYRHFKSRHLTGINGYPLRGA